MDQPYPCSSLSHVEMAQRCSVFVFQTGFVPSPRAPPPLPLPTSILSGCVCCVCMCIKCTVSVSARTQGGFSLAYMTDFSPLLLICLFCSFTKSPLYVVQMRPPRKGNSAVKPRVESVFLFVIGCLAGDLSQV